ncbi:thioesterase II family protein [Kitasatospora sp. HPMI-4]|uniref:thioesterase II family protein n=1 Tax=Kitasatospora sp. HPMI-4 TaxID=3448443 RepID=UPI003F19AF73
MNSRWLLRFPSRPEARLRMFCLPGAGASASMYRSWSALLPAEVEVCAVQFPGRGARLREAPFTRLEVLAEALAEAVLAELDRPAVIFGHSLGALVGFEVASRLAGEGALLSLAVAAHKAPSLGSAGLPHHLLPTAELFEVVARLGGTPQGVLDRPEILRLAEPATRADFELDFTYRYRERAPLDIPVSVFGGLSDPTVSEAELAAWRSHTAGAFSLRMLPGDHFFLNGPSGARMLSQLVADLNDLQQKAR